MHFTYLPNGTVYVSDKPWAPGEWAYCASEEPEPVKAGPQVPPECWNSQPVDADRCMNAIRDMCRAV